MGFWTGMANATKDRADRNERQDARDQDQAYRDKMFEYNVAQDKLATKRQTEQDGIAAEGLRYNRKAQEDALELTASNRTVDLQVEIMKLNPDLAASFGGGGTPTTGSGGGGGTSGSKGSSYVPSSAEQIQSVDYLTQQLGGAEGIKNLTGASKALFDGALSNPATAYTLHMFQQAQLKAGNDMAIEDLPAYFEIASTVSAKGEAAMQSFYESGGLAGITDNESFIKGYAALVGFKPAGLNLNQIAPVISEDDQMKTANMVREFDKVKTSELIAGKMNELRDSGVTTGPLFEIYEKIGNTNPAIAAVGRAELEREYPDLVYSGGINGGVGSASKTSTVTKGEGSSGGNVSAPMPTFATTKEANIFSKSNPEYVGKVSINGKVFDMDRTAVEPVDSTTMGQTNPPAMGEPARGAIGAVEKAERVAAKRAAIEPAVDIALGASQTAGSFVVDMADRGIGYTVAFANDLVGLVTASVAAVADKAGFTEAATNLYGDVVDSEDGSNNMREKGFFENLIEETVAGGVPKAEWLSKVRDYYAETTKGNLWYDESSNAVATKMATEEVFGGVYDTIAGSLSKMETQPQSDAETGALREMLQNTTAPEGMGESFPNENTGIQDKSLTDSQALYDILESGMSQDVIDEAIIAFEKDYGAGSARAAYEMITSRQ